MKCINKLTDEDFGLDIVHFDNPRHRYGARGIVFNKDNKIKPYIEITFHRNISLNKIKFFNFNDYYSLDKGVKFGEIILYKDEKVVPAIVTEELWDRVNKIINKRSLNEIFIYEWE